MSSYNLITFVNSFCVQQVKIVTRPDITILHIILHTDSDPGIMFQEAGSGN